jgi:hypothetical protein
MFNHVSIFFERKMGLEVPGYSFIDTHWYTFTDRSLGTNNLEKSAKRTQHHEGKCDQVLAAST